LEVKNGDKLELNKYINPLFYKIDLSLPCPFSFLQKGLTFLFENVFE